MTRLSGSSKGTAAFYRTIFSFILNTFYSDISGQSVFLSFEIWPINMCIIFSGIIDFDFDYFLVLTFPVRRTLGFQVIASLLVISNVCVSVFFFLSSTKFSHQQ